jgi:hypothetical protein
MEKRTITVCTGVGMNQIFPEYVEIEIFSDDSLEEESPNSEGE